MARKKATTKKPAAKKTPPRKRPAKKPPLGLHELVNATDDSGHPLIPAPALLARELAKAWLRKAFNSGRAYSEYKLLGQDDIDLAFMSESNEGINHIYGFEGYRPPSIAFNKHVDAYVWCVVENRKHSNNAPFDTVQPLEESARYRKEFIPKPQSNNEFDIGLNESEEKILASLVEVLGSEKREVSTDERNAAIDFVVGEIQPRLTLCLAQLNKKTGWAKRKVDEGFATAAALDDLMPQDEQEELLGYVRRMPIKDTVERVGIRGAYATACANLKRAMYSTTTKAQLSGIYWDTLCSWKALMRLHTSEGVKK
jgi:hypothetical protein